MTILTSPPVSPDHSTPRAREEDNESTDSPPPPVTWKQFLLKDYQRQNDDSSKDDFFWSMILLAGWFVIIIMVTTTKIRNWPAETEMYTSNDAVPRKGFSCDCSLPLNLQDPERPSDRAADADKTMNFNQCYLRESLETISVMQFSTNHTGIDDIVLQYATNSVLYRESEGYVVSQEAHELTIQEKAESLQNLYRNDKIGFADEDIWFPLEGYILEADFMSFPQSYVRMAFQYTCADCSSCGLDIIAEYIYNVTKGAETWGSCYYYDRIDSEQCNPSSTDYRPNTYEGKCVLYPTRTVPFAFAIKTFILDMNDTEGVSSMRPIGTETRFEKYASVQSNVVYLNRSHVTKGILRYGFVESQRGSTLRAWLLSRLPSSDTECSRIPDVRNSSFVCNGTSICNAFLNADQSIQLKCQDMRNGSACEDIVTTNTITIDNMHGDPDGVTGQAICYEPRFSCVTSVTDEAQVPAFKVTRFAEAGTNNDPINQYLNYSTLAKDWLLMSGICTNTYERVYRYNDTMFLQAECTNGTNLCKLTGKFHRLDDFFQEERQLDSRVFFNGSKDGRELFVCFKVREQTFSLWFLDYVETLFSWLSVLIFLYVSGLYKLVRFLKAKYGLGQTESSSESVNSSSRQWFSGRSPRKSSHDQEVAYDPSNTRSTITSDGSRQDRPHSRSQSGLSRLGREISMAVRNVPPVSLRDESRNDEVGLFTAPPSA